jgi:hypothetical protein
MFLHRFKLLVPKHQMVLRKNKSGCFVCIDSDVVCSSVYVCLICMIFIVNCMFVVLFIHTKIVHFHPYNLPKELLEVKYNYCYIYKFC